VSANGKKASEATTDPFSEDRDFSIAIFFDPGIQKHRPLFSEPSS
jgi:hypothetical protein